MRALVWIVEDTWEATVAEAAAFLPADAEVTLLHVAPGDVETLAEGSRQGLLGRRHRPPHEAPAPLRAISDEAAQALLVEARERFGREALGVRARHVEQRDLRIRGQERGGLVDRRLPGVLHDPDERAHINRSRTR